jgi:hypothetical protein
VVKPFHEEISLENNPLSCKIEKTTSLISTQSEANSHVEARREDREIIQ